jgi:hypothetical protein
MTVTAAKGSQISVWTDQIINMLFAAERRRLQNWVDKICVANQEATGGEPLAGYIYQGQWYRHSSIGQGKFTKTPLSASLSGEMNSFLSDKRITDMEEQLLKQGVFSVLRTCCDLQDLRDALPDCLVDCFPELSKFPRNREVAYTLASEDRPLRQFNKILPKLEVYAATRLIF